MRFLPIVPRSKRNLIYPVWAKIHALITGSGFSVRTAKYALLLIVLSAVCSWTPARAQPESKLADWEGDLLNRVVPLTGIRQWSPATGQWRNLKLNQAKVYVVNLWSVHCAPCIEEFPQLRKLVAGWKSNPEVQFLFISDPPDATTELEFTTFWQRSLAALPPVDPARSDSDALRAALATERQPVTLLLDENRVVRQAFVGSIGSRRIGAAIERLLAATRLPSHKPREP